MASRELRASGEEYVGLATRLLQRARLADADAGVWEAADIQWWWRSPRRSDTIDQLFWADERGPVAAALLTDWGGSWGCDPIVVPGNSAVELPAVWARALEAITQLGLDDVEVLARDDDDELVQLLSRSAFEPTAGSSGITWMSVENRPPPAPLPAGFRLVDRAAPHGPHPLQRRSGASAEARLRRCSLYDPTLDLAVQTVSGRLAAYALFWFDPVTHVGLLEPMRVEDEYQRRGLGRALLTAGVERLAHKGARRLKVGYGTDAARALYLGAGFEPSITTTSYRRRTAPGVTPRGGALPARRTARPDE